MSFETIFSQYPISKRIINDLDSFTDIENLAATSQSILEDVRNLPIKKDINISENTLLIFKVWDFFSYILGRSPSITFNYNDNIYNTNDLLRIFAMMPSKKLEHIKKIQFYIFDACTDYRSGDIYDNLQLLPNIETCDPNNLRDFGRELAYFINNLFELCSNADTLEFKSLLSIHFFIINYLTSSKIKILKGITIKSMLVFANIRNNNYLGCIEKLKGLEELHINGFNMEMLKIEYCANLLKDILKNLSKKEGNKFVYYGDTILLPSEIQFFNNFGNLLRLVQECKVNMAFKGIYPCERKFYKHCPVENIVEINICPGNITDFRIFVSKLHRFLKLKTIKLELLDDFFYNILKVNSISIFKKCFNTEMLKNFEKIEEFYLKVQMFLPMDLLSNNETKEQMVEIKNNAILNLLIHLSTNLRLLYLEGLPDLTQEMSDILSKNCPNITEIYLIPKISINENFVKNMKNLKFIFLKGNHRVIIPDTVEMITFYPKDNDESRMLYEMLHTQFYNHFRYLFNRTFRCSIRNCYENRLMYGVFFNKIFDWKIYIKKMHSYNTPFQPVF
uniref:F-box domain-containing protein n=1 Tax=Parastrongyloides trichosuri TaxID=131310 RepID=A0A0N4Z9M6_PARTI